MCACGCGAEARKKKMLKSPPPEEKSGIVGDTNNRGGDTGNSGRRPYLMPDGRPYKIHTYEEQQQRSSMTVLLDARCRQGSRKPRRGVPREPTTGWTTAQAHSANLKGMISATNEADAAELVAVSKLGNRKQRRWVNDHLLLREMAPQLTAESIDSLFKPVPFGDAGPPSVFMQISSVDYESLWDLFRSVDVDKQARVLAKWQMYVDELRGRHEEKSHDGVMSEQEAKRCEARRYWKRWNLLGNSRKMALMKAPRAFVEEIEGYILPVLGLPGTSARVPPAVVEDSFGRLLAHSIAAFHGLPSKSKDSPQGRYVEVVQDPNSTWTPTSHHISVADMLWIHGARPTSVKDMESLADA